MTGYKSKRDAALDEEGMYLVHHTKRKVDDDDDTQVYQRPWVGLTDEQIADYLSDEYQVMTESDLRFFRLGESAAKEKNG